MSRIRVEAGGVVSGFPRVSGDEPFWVASDAAIASFSPRERG